MNFLGQRYITGRKVSLCYEKIIFFATKQLYGSSNQQKQ